MLSLNELLDPNREIPKPEKFSISHIEIIKKLAQNAIESFLLEKDTSEEKVQIDFKKYMQEFIDRNINIESSSREDFVYTSSIIVGLYASELRRMRESANNRK